jgi:class 3 adenylate cyclase
VERKVATVLFADLVGSTELGEQDPERTRALLERFYEAMAAEVERAGGTIEKFAGDAVMAAFGAPAALEDHAERALHAALAMQSRLDELFDGRLQLRVGVNTGEVVVGEPREGSSFVTGDAVNVCARLEQNAEPGEILVGERTARAAWGAFEFGDPAQIDARGKQEPVACHRLVRALSLMRSRGLSALGDVFVGRGTELEQLRAAFRRTAEARRPHLVSVLGDAGVGKTRLVRELWEWLADVPERPIRRVGRCLPYGSGITYWPVREIIHEHYAILEGEAPDRVVARLGDRTILGLALGLDVGGELHPHAARDRLRDAWVDLLTELAAERPVVLLVEDVHWAEEPLLELLERTVRDVSGPLLLLATARPDVEWSGGRGNVTTLALEPLRDEDAERMLVGLPERMRALVVERAEGNPFFVEELTGALIDQGVLERTDDGWRSRGNGGPAMPDSVQGVLAARIDLLPAGEKDALQAASVIGRVFWDGPVRELIGHDADLALLEERDFVRRRAGSTLPGELEYAIKHALTREVAYSTLPKARRAHLHAAFASWLEQLESREEMAPLIAHHYAQAVRPEDADLVWADQADELMRVRASAVDWLERAAELAVGRYELDEALGLLRQALELEPGEARQAEVWRKIGLTSALKFEGEAFWTAMQSSLRVCHDRATCAESYADLAFQTAIRSGMWRKRPDPELVGGWIAQALELAQPDTAARAKALIARCFWERHGQNVAAAREASEIADRLGHADLRSYAWSACSATAFAALRFDEAWTWAQRTLAVVDEITDPDHVADVYEFAIPAALAVGRIGEARRLAAIQRDVCEPLSAHHRLHGVAVTIEVEEAAGAWERILEFAPLTEQRVDENLETPCARNARSLLVSALAAGRCGQSERARRYEARANDVATEGYDVNLAAPRAQLALWRGDTERALAFAPPFEEYAAYTWIGLTTLAARIDALAAAGERELVEREASPLVRPGTYFEPFALRALGIVRDDEQLVGQAVERFRAIDLNWHAEQTRTLLST